MSVWLFLLDALGKKEILVLQDFTSHGLSFIVNYFIIHILYYIDSSQIDTLFPSSYCTVLAFRDIAPRAPTHILTIPKAKDGLTGLCKAIAAMMRAQEADPTNLEVLLALGVSHTNELEQTAALKYLYGWLRHHPKYGTLAPPELANSLYYADRAATA
ncbi:hypothetical protein V6Z12_D11G000200 [Gossypium hirsutum]